MATLVLAQGRVPADELWTQLESHPAATRVGDVLGPRTLEEAVLEGTSPEPEPDPEPGRRLMGKRIGGHLVVESLEALGAEVAFGLPGDPRARRSGRRCGRARSAASASGPS